MELSVSLIELDNEETALQAVKIFCDFQKMYKPNFPEVVRR